MVNHEAGQILDNMYHFTVCLQSTEYSWSNERCFGQNCPLLKDGIHPVHFFYEKKFPSSSSLLFFAAVEWILLLLGGLLKKHNHSR